MWESILDAYHSYGRYLWKTITNPLYNGFSPFSGLILMSVLVWVLEIVIPWRKNQKVIRRDFWLDGFYMFFNYFFFNLLIFAALSKTTASGFESLMTAIGAPEPPLVDFFTELPMWAQFLTFFLISDFIQWIIHNMLHRIPFLWRFHRLHHSVIEMGFAAHLRYHFMENVVYTVGKYVVLSYFLSFKLENAFWLYSLTTLIGHLNHANLGWNYGPLKYLINNPKMHIWHHAKELPETHKKGANFGLTLSVWDYLFGTNWIPHDGKDIDLGFEDVEQFPEGFLEQQIEPFRRKG